MAVRNPRQFARIADMAESSIVSKLHRELSVEITTERQVVYILAEIRKLIELRQQSDQFFALNFHCCWALHTRMDRIGSERIVQIFDEAHEFAISIPHPKHENIPAELKDRLSQIMMGGKFVTELRDFLERDDLPLTLFKESATWIQFMSLYSDVVEECPLLLRGNSTPRHVKAVTVFKVPNLAPQVIDGKLTALATEWRLNCLNPKDDCKWTQVFLQPLPSLGSVKE